MAQNPPPQEQPKQPGQPEVRLNVLNVCTPSDEEIHQITAALDRIPRNPRFAQDFEVARGRTAQEDGTLSNWVRVRHEFPADNFFSNAQYSFTSDEQSSMEILVLRVRDPKDLMQVTLQDSVSAATTTASMMAADTPPNRIKLERFGKPGVALARCEAADQKKYEPLFATAAGLMSAYRAALGVRRIVPGELARLTTPLAKKPAAKPVKK